MPYRIGICGHFGGQQTFLDGQTVKTKVIFQELCKKYGEASVIAVDTYGYRRHPIRLYREIRQMMKRCDDVLFLPAQNGVKILLPLFVALKKRFPCRLHYIAIGGWLGNLLRTQDRLCRKAAKLDTIFVESRAMAEELQRLHLNNGVVLPNCKPLTIASENHQPSFEHPPYPLCTFSRVSRKKGISDAIHVVKKMNSTLGKTVFTLTIYGQIEEDYREEFDKLKQDFGHAIHYGGEIPFEQGSLIVSQYFALLFPTHYATEGVPGTILDAYAGGTPVLAAQWENALEVIEENQTGWLYPLGDIQALEQRLYEMLESPDRFMEMRKNCLIKAESYQSDRVLKILFRRLNP